MTDLLIRADIQEAAKWGRKLAPEKTDRGPRKHLSTSQIRKFLAQVNKFRVRVEGLNPELNNDSDKEQWEQLKSQILMLEPRFAYQVAKDDNLKKDPYVLEFKDEIVLKKLQTINTPNDFLRFALFMEAVVAFHREAGGE